MKVIRLKLVLHTEVSTWFKAACRGDIVRGARVPRGKDIHSDKEDSTMLMSLITIHVAHFLLLYGNCWLHTETHRLSCVGTIILPGEYVESQGYSVYCFIYMLISLQGHIYFAPQRIECHSDLLSITITFMKGLKGKYQDPSECNPPHPCLIWAQFSTILSLKYNETVCKPWPTTAVRREMDALQLDM